MAVKHYHMQFYNDIDWLVSLPNTVIISRVYIHNYTSSLDKEYIGSHGKKCICLRMRVVLALRSLNDISNALFAKLWWNFRTSMTL